MMVLSRRPGSRSSSLGPRVATWALDERDRHLPGAEFAGTEGDSCRERGSTTGAGETSGPTLDRGVDNSVLTPARPTSVESPRREDPKLDRFLFTVFTPTRNRGHVLHRAYESLRRQTFRDFEWLVVDNDSEDETEALVTKWQGEAAFPIRYLRHENRGVHMSRLRAVQEARGELFVTMRSADSCMPETLERFRYHWFSIPDTDRAGYVGVTALAMDDRGQIIGHVFPADVFDSSPNELYYRYGVRGEKWGFQRVDVLRRYPLPDIPGYAGYVPEGVMWARIGRRYRTRYINEVLRVYWLDQPTSVSKPANFADNAPGGLIETQEFLNRDAAWFREAPVAALLRAAKYVRCSLHLRQGLRRQWRGVSAPVGRALWLGALPVGLAVYILDRANRQDLLDRLRLDEP